MPSLRFTALLVTAAAVIAPCSAQALVPKPHLLAHGAGSAVTGVNGLTTASGVSGDGTFAVVNSAGTDLLPGFVDHNGPESDVYRVNLHTGQAELVSQSTAGGANSGNGVSADGTISPNGRFVAFRSAATDLVSPFADHNAGGSDIYVRDMDTGQTTLISHKAGGAADSANEHSYLAQQEWSSDSRYLTFFSDATDLVAGQVDAAGSIDIWRYDRVANSVALVTATAAGPTAAGGFGDNAAVSADGTHVVFDSPNTAYVSPFTNNNGTGWDVYVRDANAGTTKLVSGAGGSPSTGADGDCSAGGLSADGGAAGFTCAGTNLVPGFVNNNGIAPDAYLHSSSGATALISGAAGSATQGANHGAAAQYVSPDAGFAVVASSATNLVPGFVDGNGTDDDLFIRDVANGGTRLLTAAAAGPTHGIAADATFASASADGRTLLYTSAAADVAPGFTGAGTASQVYRYDASTGSAALVSSAGTAQGNGQSYGPRASADGSTVVLQSESTDLVPGFVDANGTSTDAFASYGVAPVAAATATATAALTASFDAAASQDPDGTIAAYAWDFGDGQTASGAQTTHVYAKGGTYAASLTVVDDSGNSATAPVSVTVKGAKRKHVSLTLSGLRTQHPGRRGVVAVAAKCDVRCRLAPSGALTGGLGKLRHGKATTAKAGKKVVLKLRVPKRRAGRVRRALRHGTAVRAKLKVVATASGRSRTSARRAVKLRR